MMARVIGSYIVSPQWVYDSHTAGHFIDITSTYGYNDNKHSLQNKSILVDQYTCIDPLDIQKLISILECADAEIHDNPATADIIVRADLSDDTTMHKQITYHKLIELLKLSKPLSICMLQLVYYINTNELIH